MKGLITTVCSTALLLCTIPLPAADINSPVHLPNKAVNKINQVRLKGLVTDDETRAQVGEELNRIGLDRFEQNGCNLNIGNTTSANSLLSGDRDVIVTGDVINVCQ